LTKWQASFISIYDYLYIMSHVNLWSKFCSGSIKFLAPPLPMFVGHSTNHYLKHVLHWRPWDKLVPIKKLQINYLLLKLYLNLWPIFHFLPSSSLLLFPFKFLLPYWRNKLIWCLHTWQSKVVLYYILLHHLPSIM
jgi:hypothetical protein